MIEVVCNACGKTIELREWEYNKKVKDNHTNFYCDRKCYLQSHKAPPKKRCLLCGNETKNKYCSRDCMYEYKRLKRLTECLCCGFEFEAKDKENVYCSNECRFKMNTKEGNPNWKGGFKQNRGYDYYIWRDRVKERDGHKCRCCGATEDLHSHHIWAWALHPDMRYEINNGLTLCINCHKEVHKLYGYEYNGEILPVNY